MGNSREDWKPWSEEESQRLFAAAEARKVAYKSWPDLAKDFPGRSLVACRQHYLALRNKASGKKQPTRSYSTRKANTQRVMVHPEDIALRQNPIHLPPPSSITAWICGDPLPGRSALDKKLEGAPA